MTDDQSAAVESGWGSVVCELSIGEVSQFHVGRDDLDVEGLVSGDILVMRGEGDQG